jgi:hypothetical protein
MTIDVEWRNYRNRVIPKSAPEIQILESRRAFYAGASAMLAAVVQAACDPGDEPTRG